MGTARAELHDIRTDDIQAGERGEGPDQFAVGASARLRSLHVRYDAGVEHVHIQGDVGRAPADCASDFVNRLQDFEPEQARGIHFRAVGE